MPELHGMMLAKEYVYILRPLIYCLLVKKFGKSIVPFSISLLLESLFLPFKSNKGTSLEKSEYVSRVKFLLLYFLRNPLYDRFVKYLLFIDQGSIDLFSG